jgi:Icc-related predicted phosphoesterase
MKIVAISDLHGYLPKIESCDVLCIAGDICPTSIDRDIEESKTWLFNVFVKWCNEISAKEIVLIAGNHDFCFQDFSIADKIELMSACYKIHYLEDGLIDIDGVTFYGTPWCPRLSGWAFYGNKDFLKERFNAIPDCDILLTHTPPQFVNKVGAVLQTEHLRYPVENGKEPDHGCMELRDAIKKKNIKYVFSGHIHSGNHNLSEWHGKKVANVSLKDEYYEPDYKPLVIEI